MKKILIAALCLSVSTVFLADPALGGGGKAPVKFGAYFFDGWSGTNQYDGVPGYEWAANAPTHLSYKLATDYSGRTPVWGWRHDSQQIMEHQIDLAADNGIDFFLYCWYWAENKGPIDERKIAADSKHLSMNLHLSARNKDRLGYALLIANHGGYEITGEENWGDAVRHWMPYFEDDLYVKVDGKPLLVVFSPEGMSDADIDRMQQVARSHGLEGITIAGCGEGVATREKIDYRTWYNINAGYSGGAEEHPFEDLISQGLAAWSGTPAQPCIPTVTIGWDKRPWEYEEDGSGLGTTPKGWYYTGRTPKKVRNFMSEAIRWMDDHPDETCSDRIVLIYAWNEIGEGGYLVPTLYDPKARFLKAVGDSRKPYGRR